MTTERTHAKLPDFLRPETIGTMSVDEPRFIKPEHLSVGPGDSIVVCGDQVLRPRNRTLRKLTGRVAIMLTTSSDYNTEGYIADFRMLTAEDAVSPGADHDDFSNDEDEDEEDMQFDCEHTLLAILTQDPSTGEDEPDGDPQFYHALDYLASQVDAARREITIGAKSDTEPFHFSLQDRLLAIPAIRLKETLGLND